MAKLTVVPVAAVLIFAHTPALAASGAHVGSGDVTADESQAVTPPETLVAKKRRGKGGGGFIAPRFKGPWGMVGGATMGGGMGIRGGLVGGGGPNLIVSGSVAWGGLGNFGLEGMFMLGLGRNMDLGFGARIPFYNFGLSPGATFRLRFIEEGPLQLAFEASAYLSFGFPSNGFLFLFDVEPGVMGSYFLARNMEIVFGLLVPMNFGVVNSNLVFISVSTGVFMMVFDFRGGFVYTIEKIGLGIYGLLDLAPGFYAANGTNGQFAVMLRAGVQYRF